MKIFVTIYGKEKNNYMKYIMMIVKILYMKIFVTIYGKEKIN